MVEKNSVIAFDPGAHAVAHRDIDAGDLMTYWLSGRSPHTVRAYKTALASFLLFLDPLAKPGDLSGLRVFLEGGHATANAAALSWRSAMIEDVKADKIRPQTLNLRLAALRSVVKLARLVGLVNWTVDVSGVKARTLKDTRGPGVKKLQAVMKAAKKQGDKVKAARDVALLRLMFDCGLRRAEIVSLDVADVDLAGGVVLIRGKGRLEKETRPLSPAGVEAVRKYLAKRGNPAQAAPLFLGLSPTANENGRLTGAGLYYIIGSLARRAGVGHIRPHGIRHTAITALLDANDGNLRDTQAFSRHAKPETVMVYDDTRQEAVRESTRMLSDMLA